jgi:hypothetical protein
MRSGGAPHPVSAGEHQKPVHRLDGPAALDEADGQPVEQFGMTRFLAAIAEVVAGRHQASAEVMLPDAVDHDASRQRIVRRGDPAGQLQSPALRGRQGWLLRTGHDAREVTGDCHSEGEAVAAPVNAQVDGLALLWGHDRDRRLSGALGQRPFLPHGRVAVLVLERLRAAEDAGQAVVVGRRDGIELVVVAAGTADRQAEEGPAHDVDLFIHDVQPRLFLVRLGQRLGIDHEEASGHDPPRRQADVIRGRQQVARQLLDNELIVGRVAVEGIDDVIAIAPGVAHDGVGVVGRGVRMADDVEPVPAEALSIVRRSEQAIDHPGEGIGRPVALEGCDLLRRGRQADQVERRSTDEGTTIGGRSGGEALRLEPSQDEPIDRRGGPVCRPHRRRKLISGGLEGPEGFARRCWRRRHCIFRPGSTAPDPVRQGSDLGCGEFALGRHVQVAGLPDGLDEQTSLGIARHDDRSRVAAVSESSGRVQPQSALVLRGPVALPAPRRQQGPHLLLEMLHGRGRRTCTQPGSRPTEDDHRGEQRQGGSAGRGHGLAPSHLFGRTLAGRGKAQGQVQPYPARAATVKDFPASTPLRGRKS